MKKNIFLIICRDVNLKFKVMKKVFFRICVFLLTGQIMFNGTNAQTTLTETGYKKNIRFENQVSSSKESNSVPDSQVTVLNYINIKAIRDFTRSYTNVTDAKWFKSNSEYMVYFTSDGIRSRIYYDKNGSRGIMIRFITRLPTIARR